jgi:hypothetical protein
VAFIVVKAFTFLLFIAFTSTFLKLCVLCWSFSLSLFVFSLFCCL